MTRLSIIVPMQGQAQTLEEGLVTVLQHRPENAEILVVLDGPYDDPYELEGEVRFVRAPHGASWTRCANLGLEQSRGEFVAVLSNALEVTAGWAEAALARLEADDSLAAVSPVVVETRTPNRTISTGVAYGAFGRRRIVGAGKNAGVLPKRALIPAAPTWRAGVYRRDPLTSLGGWAENVGDRLADADLAARWRRAGLRTVCEPGCVIRASANAIDRAPLGFRDGVARERLFVRNASPLELACGVPLRPLAALFRGLRNVSRPLGAVASLLGCLVAWLSLPQLLADRRRSWLPGGVRFDAAHPDGLDLTQRRKDANDRQKGSRDHGESAKGGISRVVKDLRF